MNRSHTLLMGFALVCLIFSAAYAGTRNAGHANDALGLGEAKITLVQAISAAEQARGGSASRAEFETDRDGQLVYEVEVVASNEVFDVTVDALDGKILGSRVDKADHEGDDDREGEHEDDD